MTKEEAIEMLNKDKEQRGECLISEALDYAIQAIKDRADMKAKLAEFMEVI